jgi:hypothetical protein
LPTGLGVVLGDRHDQPLDLGFDALELLVEEGKLVPCRLAAADLDVEPALDLAALGARREPLGAFGEPLRKLTTVERGAKGGQHRAQRLQRLELRPHLLDDGVDVAVGQDRFAQVADADRIPFQDQLADEFGRRLVMAERHRVHDSLQERRGVLLAIGQMRQQMPHVFSHVVARPVALVDEVVGSDRRDDPRAHLVPLRRIASALPRLDEILGRQDAADHDEAAKHGLVGFRLARLQREPDADRRPRAFGIDKAQRDIGARLVTPALIIAQHAEAIADHAALGAGAAAPISGHRVEPLEVAAAAGEHHLRHVEDRRLAGAVLAEHADMAADLDVLDVEQVPVHHGQMPELLHAAPPGGPDISLRVSSLRISSLRVSSWRT